MKCYGLIPKARSANIEMALLGLLLEVEAASPGVVASFFNAIWSWVCGFKFDFERLLHHFISRVECLNFPTDRVFVFMASHAASLGVRRGSLWCMYT